MSEKKKRKPSNIRLLTALGVFLVIGMGLALPTGLGTPSSFGWDAIATICPVGFLETFLAKWVITPHGLICLVVVVALILVFGRSFCGWLCPVPLFRRMFGGKKSVDRERSDLKDVCASGCASCAHACSSKVAVAPAAAPAPVASDSAAPAAPAAAPASVASGSAAPATKPRFSFRNGPFDSRHAVLIGALVSTAIFGVPVFCLICPVGLSVATFIGLWRLIRLDETTWSLIVFPAILILEVFVLRKWCHRLCPLSAAISLVSKGNATLRPTVDARRCLRVTGQGECHACYKACPEGIDLHDLAAGAPLNECMKCRECAYVCPTQAITFPLAPAKVRDDTRITVVGTGGGDTAPAKVHDDACAMAVDD